MAKQRVEKRKLGDVLRLDALRSITIHQVWESGDEHSPLVAAHDLVRTEDGGLRGSGEVRSQLAGSRPIDDVVVPPALATKVIAEIGLATLDKRAYQPKYADSYYPRIEIAVHVGATAESPGLIALLFSESATDFYAPWGVSIRESVYRSETTAIGRALHMLGPVLREGELNDLTREFDEPFYEEIDGSPRTKVGDGR